MILIIQKITNYLYENTKKYDNGNEVFYTKSGIGVNFSSKSDFDSFYEYAIKIQK